MVRGLRKRPPYGAGDRAEAIGPCLVIGPNGAAFQPSYPVPAALAVLAAPTWSRAVLPPP